MSIPHNLCLLLVAPDDARGEFLRHLLSSARPDAELVSAARPEDALRKIEKGSVSAVIAEGTDGLALINLISEGGGAVPVIFIAPDDESDLLDQARAAGASEAIFRSELSPATLQNALHYALLWTAPGTEEEKVASKAMHTQILGMERTESLARIACSIAHEVRNPLSLIMLAADFLARPKPLTDEIRTNVVNYLRHGASRIDDVVTSVLAACAPKELVLAAHDTNSILDEALHSVESRIPPGIQVRVVKDCAANLPAVYVDRARMVDAVRHLLTNAIDAMPGGGELGIRSYSHTFASSERADWQREGWFRAGDVAVLIEISDTGHGIPEGKLNHIYELFFTTKTAGHGAGLGLAAVQKIVQLHNGRISITNRPTGGVLAMLTLKTAAQ